MKKICFLLLCFGWAVGNAAQSAHSHTVKPRDTLWDLAKRYYNDPCQWPRIAQANPSPSVKDPNLIHPGQILSIPDLPPAEPLEQEEPSPMSQPAVSEPSRPKPPPAEAQPAAYNPQGSSKMIILPEGLSAKIPGGLVGQPPAMYRLRAAPGWTPDGSIVEREEFRLIAVADDWVTVRIDSRDPIGPGARLSVFRKSAPSEEDNDPAAVYLTKVGVIELRERMKNTLYRALVLACSDSVQDGDWVQRGD